MAGPYSRVRNTLIGLLGGGLLMGAAPAFAHPAAPAAHAGSKASLARIQAEDKAFQNSLRGFPSLSLSPRMIKEYQKRRDAIDRVVRSGDGHLSYSVVPVHLNPGARAPVVDLTTGTVLALDFIDDTGAPWPLTSETVGNPRWFHVTLPKKLPQGNLLLITPLVRVGTTNVVVTLKDEDSPITVVLRSRPHRTLLPSVVNVAVPGIGPEGVPPTLITAGPSTVTASQIAFLDGVPPTKARPLTVSPMAATQVWSYHGQLYVRTRSSLVFPAWTAVVRGGRHMRVYTVPTAPVLLLMRHGTQTQLTVHGDDRHG